MICVYRLRKLNLPSHLHHPHLLRLTLESEIDDLFFYARHGYEICCEDCRSDGGPSDLGCAIFDVEVNERISRAAICKSLILP